MTSDTADATAGQRTQAKVTRIVQLANKSDQNYLYSLSVCPLKILEIDK